MRYLVILLATILVLSCVYLGYWYYLNYPKNLKVSEGKSSIVVRWDSLPTLGLSHYEIFRQQSNNLEKIRVADNLGTNLFEDENAEQNKKYIYTIYSVNFFGLKSKFGQSSEFSWSIPNASSGLKLQKKDEDQKLIMVITWIPSNDKTFSHYEIWRSPYSYPHAPYGELLNSHLLANEYRDENFEGNGLFYFIRVVDEAGNKSNLTRFVVYRDGGSFMSQVQPELVKNYGEIP